MQLLNVLRYISRFGFILVPLTLLLSGCGGGGGSNTSPNPNPNAPIAEWRIPGSAVGAPWGIALDSGNNVYVAELFGNKIDKFSSTGTLITQWGSGGAGNSQFNRPKYIDLDGSGNVYVADNMNHRVQKFSSSGAYLAQWGSYGITGNGFFNGPTGIAVDIAGTAVYVVDSNNSRIQKFYLDGVYIAQWGSLGTGNGQFQFDDLVNGLQGPEGDIAIDSTGAVYVVDNWNHRVQKFSSSGTYITQWGSAGSGNGQFLYPSGIAIGSSDSVYVVDNSTRNNATGNVARIEKFDSSGHFISQWNLSGMGAGACGGGLSTSAIDVSTDSTGALYVTQGECIDKYAPH